MSESIVNGRRVALVTRARAPYHRALQEAFAAEAKSAGGELGLFYPQDAWCPFDQETMKPSGANITITQVSAGDVSSQWFQIGRRWKAEAIGTRLPSRAQWLALKSFRPTDIWIHEFSPFCLGGLLYARRNGLPVIVSSEVGSENVEWFPGSVRRWHHLWGQFVDGWIAQTPAARRPVCHSKAPVVEAYHAADSRKLKPRARAGRKPGRTQFVQVGRVLPRKGADLLLAALAWVKSQGRVDWELKLLGPDSDGWGAAQVERFGLEGWVSITGHLDGDSLWEVFSDADVFTLATRQDTYAAVVHEAACLGLPLIVSRHAGAAQALVRDDVNGWVVDPEDSAGYGARLMQMLDGPTRDRMSVESRRVGEAFSAHERGPAIWRWMSDHFGLS